MAFIVELDGTVRRRLTKHAKKHGFATQEPTNGGEDRTMVDYGRIAEFACCFAAEHAAEFDAFVARGVADIEAERERVAEHNRKARSGGGQ